MITPLVETLGARLALGGEAVFAGWRDAAAVFVTGEASVIAVDAAGEALARHEGVHEGAALSACFAADGAVLTGGDDGRVVQTAIGGESSVLAALGGWIDAIDASAASGAIVAAAGKDVALIAADGRVAHRFAHEHRVAGVKLEPNGRRFAAAHYNGATLSWASNPASRRKTLAWKGAHVFPLWSPDARYLLTSMQENTLHGWRLQDGSHFRMAGYPAKIRAMSFSADGRWLATAGAPEVVCWPFDGPQGPVNREGLIAGALDAPVTAVACHPRRPIVAAGAADGEITLFPIGQGPRPVLIDAADGAAITVVAWDRTGARLAYAGAEGRAGVLDLTSLEA